MLEGASERPINIEGTDSVGPSEKLKTSSKQLNQEKVATETNKVAQKETGKSESAFKRIGQALQKGIKGAGLGRFAMNAVLRGKMSRGKPSQKDLAIGRQYLEFKGAQKYGVIHESIDCAGGKGKLDVVHLKQPEGSESKGTIVWHNMQEGSWQDSSTQDTFESFLNEGFDVVCYDYRGVMNSSGKVSDPQDLVDDAKVVHKWAQDRGAEKISHQGQSLGGAVAVVVTDQLLQDYDAKINEIQGDTSGQLTQLTKERENIGDPTSVNSFNTLGNTVRYLGVKHGGGIITGAIAQVMTRALGFRLNAGESAVNIAKREGRSVEVGYTPDDEVIRSKAQLRHTMEGIGNKNVSVHELTGKHTDAYRGKRSYRQL